MKSSLLQLYLVVLPLCSEAFSTAPQGHFGNGAKNTDVGSNNNVDSEEIFSMETLGNWDSDKGNVVPRVSNHRRRYSVNFIPATPQPPLHSPNFKILERSDMKISNAVPTLSTQSSALSKISNLSTTTTAAVNPVNPTSILAAAASGLWTVAPVLYFHCINQLQHQQQEQYATLPLFPLMLFLATIEVSAMVLTLVRSNYAQGMVPFFFAIRMGIAYFISIPWDIPFEVLEALILYGSSSLALEAFTTQDEAQQRKSTSTNRQGSMMNQTPKIESHTCQSTRDTVIEW